MSDTLQIAALQLNSGANLAQNLRDVKEKIEKVLQKGAQVVALPENFAYFGFEKEKLEGAQNIYQQTLDMLCAIAHENTIEIMAGGFPEPAPGGKTFNTAVYINHEGIVLSTYRKIHLFDTEPGDGIAYKESNTVQAGAELPGTFSMTGAFCGGMSVCYDVRFPEIYRALSRENVDIIFIPAAFTQVTGEAHWHILLRARAIENSCYVVAPAQFGKHSNGKQTYGHTLIINPWGEILSEAVNGQDYAMATISKEHIRQVRTKLPGLSHRKFG